MKPTYRIPALINKGIQCLTLLQLILPLLDYLVAKDVAYTTIFLGKYNRSSWITF
jgi:hypothetical protein